MPFDLVNIVTLPSAVVTVGSGYYQNLGSGYLPLDLWLNESPSSLADGTFESYAIAAGAPRGWEGIAGTSFTQGASYATVQDGVSSGKAARLTVGSGTSRQATLLEQTIKPCTPGEIIRFNVTAKSSDVTNGRIRIDVRGHSTLAEFITSSSALFTATGAYQTFEYNWTVPAGATSYRAGVTYLGPAGIQVASGSTATIDNFITSIVLASNRPTVPRTVTYTQQPTSITLSWSTPVSTGGSAITGYFVGRDGFDSNGGGPWNTTVSATQFSVTFLSLVPGNTYNLTVAAVNANGQGVSSVTTVTMASSSVIASPPGSTFDLIAPLAAIAPLSPFEVDITNAPVHPNSQEYIDYTVNNQITPHWGGIAAANLYDFTTNFHIVGPDVPVRDMYFYDGQNKGYVPGELYDAGGLQTFKNVPIPENAIPASGTDKMLLIYQPSTDKLWEFWIVQKMTGTFNEWGVNQRVASPTGNWAAVWGGRIDNASASDARFKDYTGVAATAISYAATTIRIKEAQAGLITHAMALQVIDSAPTSSYPAGIVSYNGARRYDSGGGIVPQGLRLRLKPSFNVEASNLHPFAKTIATAAKKYGFVITDTAGAVSIVGESGTGIASRNGGTNPWDAILNGTQPYNLMANFPWSQCEYLPYDWGRPA